MQVFLSTNFIKVCEAPFNVDLVSDAKCQERVLEAGEPELTQ